MTVSLLRKGGVFQIFASLYPIHLLDIETALWSWGGGNTAGSWDQRPLSVLIIASGASGPYYWVLVAIALNTSATQPQLWARFWTSHHYGHMDSQTFLIF